MTNPDNLTTPLDAQKISSLCNSLGCDIDVVVLPEVGSTNTWLLEYNVTSPVTLCATEHQTEGRGRRGKVWHSPGNGVTFSLRLERSEPVSEFGGLSLLVGAALCDQLRTLGATDAMVKWPNDVLVNNAKLAGILIETSATAAENPTTTVIIGIGVNYRRGDEARLIDQSSTDLSEICSTVLPDRSELIACVASAVTVSTLNNISLALKDLASRWADYDAFSDRELLVETTGGHVSGRALGIDASGALLLETDAGPRTFTSAEISVRPR